MRRCHGAAELIKEEGILEHLGVRLSENELEKLHLNEKRKISRDEYELKLYKSKSLEDHFEGCNTKIERDSTILNVIEDGYTQSDIARYLDLSSSSISKIVNKK